MNSYVTVDNVRCNGCATTISKQLDLIPTISNVIVEIKTGKISFTCLDDRCTLSVVSVLKKCGYPLSGKGSKVDMAKSVISCVKGKINNLS